jgi:hypothetical protein
MSPSIHPSNDLDDRERILGKTALHFPPTEPAPSQSLKERQLEPAMNRALALLLPLALTACSTKNVPLVGYDQPPDGTLPLDGDAPLSIEAAMELDMPHTFRFRFNGKYGVQRVATGGSWVYLEAEVKEWVAGSIAYGLAPSGVYTVEMIDESGTTWGQSSPITVQKTGSFRGLTIIFVHLDGVQKTWVLDQSTRDADPATLEVTISNLSSADVPVARCQIDSRTGGAPGPQDCTSLGTVAPGADLQTIEMLTTDTMATFAPILSVGSTLESLASSGFAGNCQVDRIVVTGVRTLRDGSSTPYAFSACQGF